MIRSACISDILLPRNVLVTFFLLIKHQSRSPSGIQPNQANTQHCLALSSLSAALTLLLVAACFNPRLFDLAASTSIDADELLPRSLPSTVLLDPVPQTLWSRGCGGGISSKLSSNKLLNVNSPTYQILFKLTNHVCQTSHLRALGPTSNQSLGPQNRKLVILLRRQPIIVLSTIPPINPFALIRSRTLTVPFQLTFVQTRALAHCYQLNRFSVIARPGSVSGYP